MDNPEPLWVLLRYVLSIAGTLLMGHGYVSSNDWAAISGAVIMVAPVLYGMWKRTKPQMIKTTAALPEVNKVELLPTKGGADLAEKTGSTPEATVTVQRAA